MGAVLSHVEAVSRQAILGSDGLPETAGGSFPASIPDQFLRGAVHGIALAYLCEIVDSYNPGRYLHSLDAGYLKVPMINKTLVGGPAFNYAAPKLWNSLPLTVKNAPLDDTDLRWSGGSSTAQEQRGHKFNPSLTHSQVLTHWGGWRYKCTQAKEWGKSSNSHSRDYKDHKGKAEGQHTTYHVSRGRDLFPPSLLSILFSLPWSVPTGAKLNLEPAAVRGGCHSDDITPQAKEAMETERLLAPPPLEPGWLSSWHSKVSSGPRASQTASSVVPPGKPRITRRSPEPDASSAPPCSSAPLEARSKVSRTGSHSEPICTEVPHTCVGGVMIMEDVSCMSHCRRAKQSMVELTHLPAIPHKELLTQLVNKDALGFFLFGKDGNHVSQPVWVAGRDRNVENKIVEEANLRQYGYEDR
ncbi:hypothetical protein Z043_108691 [Scleropages formosus]|uniref:Uncharacterized protein n=1 Tax=Scleropages formosus TaxID=113540 RepID=A0A0P7X5Z6_SCLFO|nr:hypothetical protein Z043_108691 [Scleropages formosus]